MKELIKQTIVSTGALRLFSPSASAAIVMYHSVMDDPGQHADSLGGIIHSQSQFRAQMELLARNYHPISLDDVVKKLNAEEALPTRSVVITFDDGYTDNYEVAMPILNKVGVPATFYVTIDCVENRKLPWPSRLRFAFRTTKRSDWIAAHGKTWDLSSPLSREKAFLLACDECCQLSGTPQEQFVVQTENQLEARVPAEFGALMMTYEQVRGLVQNGHIVGSHTMTHPNMAHINERDAEMELAESKRRLESELKIPVPHFSYPCPAMTPHWNDETVVRTRAAGYSSAVTTNGGVVRKGDNPLSLKRIRPTKTAAGLHWNMECAFAGRVV
jgi:peptidoglycan/xylan/chitin deacetylase (PgdA/CDA1 family)